MRKALFLGVSMAGAMLSTPVLANELNVNGFLSVGATMLDDDKASIAGADTNGGFKNETVLGLQISKQLNPSTTATGQLVSRGSDDYDTEAAWAFVTIAPTDNTDIRMGRLRIPFFQYSDFLEVGYAYNWVRPPGEVYRIPFSSLDGVDLTHRFNAGSVDGAVQAYYGRYQGPFRDNGTEYAADFRNFTGIALSANMGDFGTRLSYHQAENIMDTSDPDSALGQAGAGAALIAQGLGDAAAAEDFNFTGQTSQFAEAALTYDNGDISAVAEWTAMQHESSLLLDDTAWLIAVAKRFGDMTAHLTYTAEKAEFDSGNEGAIQEQLPLQSEQTSIIAGVRYDYDASTAFKFEIQNNDEETSQGAEGDSATLYSVAVDVVF